MKNSQPFSRVCRQQSAARRNPPGRCRLFGLVTLNPFGGWYFFIKFYGDPTPKPTDGFGGLTPIFRGFLGVSGFGSQLCSFWESISQDPIFNKKYSKSIGKLEQWLPFPTLKLEKRLPLDLCQTQQCNRLVFIGDQIEISPNTRYWDWIDLWYNPNLSKNWYCIERSNPNTRYRGLFQSNTQ
jgi:hypothetical protein